MVQPERGLMVVEEERGWACQRAKRNVESLIVKSERYAGADRGLGHRQVFQKRRNVRQVTGLSLKYGTSFCRRRSI